MDRNQKGVISFIGVIVFLAVMKLCSSLVLPLALALFIFILVNPVMERMEKLHIPTPLAMILVLLIVACICIVFVYLLFAMVNMILAKLPEYIAKVTRFDNYISLKLREVFNMTESQFPSVITMLNIDWVGQLKNALTKISSTSVSILGDVAMILLYLMFLLLERATLFPKINEAFPDSKNEAGSLASNIGHQTSRYLSVKVLISAATGVLFYLTAHIGGMDFPLVWGVLAFLLNFIPTIGSIVVTFLATFVAAIQFMPSWSKVFVLFFMFLIIQMILGNVLDPKLQGVSLNLSPLVILIMLSIWGYIWGIVGMFLAVPITSVLQVACANIPSLRPWAVLMSSGTSLGRRRKGVEDGNSVS